MSDHGDVQLPGPPHMRQLLGSVVLLMSALVLLGVVPLGVTTLGIALLLIGAALVV